MSDPVSHACPASDYAAFVSSSTGFSDQKNGSGEKAGENNSHRLIPVGRSEALIDIQGCLKREGLLDNINESNCPAYPELSIAIKEYFKKGSAVLFDMSNQLINAVLAVDGVKANEVLDTLVVASESYFSDPDTVVNDDVTKAFVQAFLHLKDKNPSKAFRQAVGDALWFIHNELYESDNVSRSTQWLLIDANLMFDQWREECDDVTELVLMAEDYCFINKPDTERLKVLIEAIKCEVGGDHDKKFRSVFIGMATKYFGYNASDAAVARLLIETVAWLFENGEVYNAHSYFGVDSVIYRDLPVNIKLHDALLCCFNWFFHEGYSSSDKKVNYYLPEEQGGLKTPRALSELIDALWEEGGGDYNAVELARLVYQVDSDARRQLCLVESLFLLEEQTPRRLPASIKISSLVDAAFGFYLDRIKTCPQRMQSLLSLVSAKTYSDRCREYIKDSVGRFFPVAGISNNAIDFNAQETVVAEGQCVDIFYHMAPERQSDILRVIQNSFKQSSSKNRLLDTISNGDNLTYPELNAAIGAWFKAGDAVSFDASNQLLNAVLAVGAISAGTVFRMLMLAAETYFSNAGANIKDDIVRVLMQAFLRLKSTESPGAFEQNALEQSIGNVLWNIYCCIRDNKNISRDVRWIVIDTNLQFNRWRGESSSIKLTAMAEDYCSVNKPEPEKLKALIDVIKRDMDGSYNEKLWSVFRKIATGYFACNASDASVARLLIDAVSWLFENNVVYYCYQHFVWDEPVFCDLPDKIDREAALACCVNWFFYEDQDYSDDKTYYYLPEEQSGRKSPRVLSELIGGLWEKEGNVYSVTDLAQLTHEKDDAACKQLCIVESLVLLEEQKSRRFPASVDVPSVIDSVIGFNFDKIKADSEKIHQLLVLVSGREYSDSCRAYIIKNLVRHFEFLSVGKNTVSVSAIMSRYFDGNVYNEQVADSLMRCMNDCLDFFSGDGEFSSVMKILKEYVLCGALNPEITQSLVKKLINFKNVDYHEVIRKGLLELSEYCEDKDSRAGNLGAIVSGQLPDV